MIRAPLCVLAALGLSACMAPPPAPTAPLPGDPPGAAALCNAAPAQGLIGRTASTDTGASALAQSGARTLRWGPPGSMWTMDFRQDRVNLRYDAAMTITEISCG